MTYQHKLIASLDDPIFSSPEYLEFIARIGSIAALYYSPAWMKVWAPLYLPKGHKLHFWFLVDVQTHAIIALLPLVLERKNIIFGFVLRRLSVWGDADCYSQNPCQMLLVMPNNQHFASAYFIQMLQQAAGWDVLRITRWRVDDVFLRKVQEFGVKLELTSSPYQSYSMHTDALEVTRGDMLLWLHRKTRHCVRKGEKNLRNLERGLFRVVTEPSKDLLHQLTVLHQQRQNKLVCVGRDRRSFMTDEKERAVVESAMQLAAKEGRLYIYLVEQQQSVIAFCVVLSAHAAAFHYFCAFDDAYDKTEINRFLWFKMTEHAQLTLGVKALYQGYGDSVIKREMTSERYDLLDGVLFSPRGLSLLKARLFLWLSRAKRLMLG